MVKQGLTDEHKPNVQEKGITRSPYRNRREGAASGAQNSPHHGVITSATPCLETESTIF